MDTGNTGHSNEVQANKVVTLVKIWDHFETSKDKQSAKCKMCNKLISTKQQATSGLHGHLKSIHNLATQKKVKTGGKNAVIAKGKNSNYNFLETFISYTVFNGIGF